VVKLGTHEKPRNEVVPSKRRYTKHGFDLVDAGKTEEAKKYFRSYCKPEDTSLILTQAYICKPRILKRTKKLINEVLENSPNDADLVFNQSVMLMLKILLMLKNIMQEPLQSIPNMLMLISICIKVRC
jgi:NDP-sugar pyrophosphorylase family protein